MNKSPDVLNSLYQFLNKNFPNNLLIPCSSKKRPIFKHKNNVWTWKDVVKNQKDFGTDYHQAILIKDLIVIDIDKKSIASKFEILFPILTKCPRAKKKLFSIKSRFFFVFSTYLKFFNFCSSDNSCIVISKKNLLKILLKILIKLLIISIKLIIYVIVNT